ncbi:hypothetical protein ERJ75_001605600 [Trypanosoma vivax]|nr:hypothetical protein ERJ75_001605600 [Trypanosoma vivax]
MFFLLFLFLGALGAQAVENAICVFTKGEDVNCSFSVCFTVEHKNHGNVTCNCKDQETLEYYTLEFHERNEDECTITAMVKTTSCQKGEKNCMEKRFGEHLQKSTFGITCKCGDEMHVQNQDKKAEGTQNQGKKAEGAQYPVKKAEGAQNQGEPESENRVPQDSVGAQNSERPGEVPSSESSTGASSASEGNAKQSAQQEKKEEGVSAAARNSQEVAFLYPLFSFIAAMPRIN